MQSGSQPSHSPNESAPESGAPSTVDFAVAPAVVARLVGMCVVLVAVIIFGATGFVALANLHTVFLLIPVLLGIGLIGFVWWLRNTRGWLVRFTEDGYRVQWVRGVGVESARWTEVEEAVTAEVSGTPVVVMRLRDGSTSTIPVEMLAIDREEFVRELQRWLDRVQGPRNP